MTAGTLRRSALVRYFRLRPALSWSLLSFTVMMLVIITFRWTPGYDEPDFVDLSRFEMVEFRLEAPAEPEPEVSVTDDAAPPEETEEPLDFGDEHGDFSAITSGAVPPRPQYSSLPEYPRSMRSAGIEGVVVIELGINTDGTVLYGKIVRSMGREFDRAAIEWVKRISFYPALDPDNKPFACRINLPIKFKLDN